MSDAPKTSRLKKFSKWFLVRLPLALLIAGLLMLGALKMAERYPEPLHQGLEDFLSQQLNANATIGHLEKMSFVPNLKIDLSDVTIHSRQNAALVEMEIKSARMSIPLWSMFLSASRLNNLKVEGLSAKAGVLFPQPIKVETMQVIDRDGPEQYGSFVIANGTYGAKNMVFEAEIEKMKYGYRINNAVPFSLQIADEEVNAQLDKGFSKVWLKNLIYSKAGKQSVAKNYLFRSTDEKDDTSNPLNCILGYDGDKDCSSYLITESTL